MIYKILLFIFLSFSLFSQEYKSKEERIKTIDKEITALMEKTRSLENLKEKIEKSNSEGLIDGDFKTSRPKIALVLSGGGAKGAAHIGVLKTLEKYQIPIDFIVGTSAGSIIGAMYSVGYSPEEIEKLILEMNFLSLMNNNKDRALRTIEDKFASEKYPFKVNIDKNMNLSLPMGFLNGEYIYLQLKDIFSRAEGIENFDAFPIPFRAITTNLNSGKETVIKSGDLALATFKSMAIPSFLEPVQDGKDFFVDGGVTNNIPVDTAIIMGADIVIAVDIGANPSEIIDNSNVVSVLDKIATYNGNKNINFQKQLADILIVPDVKDHNTIDFSNLDSLVNEGIEATLKFDYLLKNLSFSKAFTEQKNKTLPDKNFKISNIQLIGNSILTEKKVRDLAPKTSKNIYSKKDLELWSKKIYAIPYIEKVYYKINNEEITFTVKEKDNINIGASLNYISDYGASMKIATTVPNFGAWTQNYTLTAELSKYPKINLGSLSFYEIGNFKILGSVDLGYKNFPYFLFRDGDKVSTYKGEIVTTELSLGTTFSNSVVSGIKLGYEYHQTDYYEGEKIYKDFNGTKQFVYLKPFIYFDTLDNKAFPSSGTSLLLLSFIGEEIKERNEYNGFSGIASLNFPLNNKLSISLGGSLGKIIGNELENNKLFRLGGSKNSEISYAFTGLPIMGRYADEFYIGEFGFKYNLSDTLYLLARYNILTYSSPKLSFQKNSKLWKDKYQGYGAGIGWDTFLGPMAFMATNNIDTSSPIFELYLGHIF